MGRSTAVRIGLVALVALACLTPTTGPTAAPATAAVDPSGEFTALTPARILDTRTGLGAAAGPIGASGWTTVKVAGRGGVPSTGVSAVVMNVTAVDSSAYSYLTVWASGRKPDVSNLNLHRGRAVANLVTTKLGADGSVRLHNSDGTSHVLFDVVGFYSSQEGPRGGRFHKVAASRLLDTRPSQPLGAGRTRALAVIGRAGIPVSGVNAVVVNLTVTEPTAVSYLTVYPADAARPTASNLNVVTGQTRANLVTVRVPASGIVNIYNAAGSAHVIADVVGYYGPSATNAGRFVAIEPTRLLDTRRSSSIGPGQGRYVPLDGAARIPMVGAANAVLNVTIETAPEPTYLTVHLGECPKPLTSDVNASLGEIVPNLVIASTRTEECGYPVVTNARGYAGVLVDVFGYFTDAAYVVDESYGSGGFATVDTKWYDGPRKELLVQPDGSVVAEASNSVVRIRPDGRRDTTFNAPEWWEMQESLDVASDGRILTLRDGAGPLAVTRLRSDGSPDPEFGSGGTVEVTTEETAYASLRAGRDRTVYVVYKPAATGQCTVLRLTPSGARDPAFGAGAPVAVAPVYADADAPRCLELLVRADNSVIVVDAAGGATKLTASGTVDPTYGRDARAWRGNWDVELLPDGGHVAAFGGTADTTGNRLGVARFDANGNFVTAFGRGGVDVAVFEQLQSGCINGAGGNVAWVGAGLRGEIVAVGAASCSGLIIARWKGNEPDPSLGWVGRSVLNNVTYPLGQTIDAIGGGDIGPDGSLYMMTSAAAGAGVPVAVARLDGAA